MVKPLFLLSLPRSGSTLVQRVLSADERIASVAEPWILLPLIYATREQGTRASYDHRLAYHALTDFMHELPEGRHDYISAISSAIRELYVKATKNGDAVYFLDKTPRYALIANEIGEMFPEARFIVLWRNPLAIIGSLIESWGEGRWNVSSYEVDLFDGLASLVKFYQARPDRVLSVNYENFLRNPEVELDRMGKYLGFEFDAGVLARFAQVAFKGQMGDSIGVARYQSIDPEPLEKWKAVLNTPLRRWWCRRYLQWLGEDRLSAMGYSLQELLSELGSTRTTIRYTLSDGKRMLKLRAKAINYLQKHGNEFS